MNAWLDERRWSITRDDDGVTIVVARKRRPLVAALTVAWLLLWLWIEMSACTDMLDGSHGVALFFMVWTTGGTLTLGLVVWLLLEKEIITIRKNFLFISRQIGRMGRGRRFDRAHVEDLRVEVVSATASAPATYPEGPGSWGGFLAFDYGGLTYRFGLDLYEAEARLLLADIRANIGEPATLGGITMNAIQDEPRTTECHVSSH